jgi:uncharacterized protein (TIGR02147 family)
MTSFTIPNLFEQENAGSFFANFVSVNSHRKNFSQRGFSTKIGWPVSFLPDLIKGRKKFSIERAIQFGNFVKLDPVHFEKLIYLAIADSYEAGENLQRISGLKTFVQYDNVSENLATAKASLIFMSVQWLQSFATEKNIIALAGERKISPEETRLILNLLVESKVIEKSGSIYVGLVNELSLNFVEKTPDTYMKYWKEFADFHKIFLENTTGPSIYSSAFMIVEQSAYEEIKSKILAFRNWLLEMSNSASNLDPSVETCLYQCDLNLTMVTSRESAKELRS